MSALSTAFDSETGRFERIEEVYIHEVVSGGLAEGNLQAGDIVLSIAVGDKVKAVTRQHHLIDAMLNVRVGDTVTTTVLRDGEEIAISTVITEDCLTAY